MIKKLPLLILNVLIILVFPTSAFAGNATLSLSPSTLTFNKGCTYTVDIILDTGGAQTDGTDVILKYDPAIFNVNSTLKQGTIYADYPGSNVDSTNGKITMSGLASISSPFTGKGTLGSFTFTVKDTAASTVTQVNFDFDAANKLKTSDSNVIERGTGTDVLNSVVNGNYTVGTGACSDSAVTPTPTAAPGGTLPRTGGQGTTYNYGTPSAQPYYKPLPPQLPAGGTQELTATVAIVGGILTVLGILGFVLL